MSHSISIRLYSIRGQLSQGFSTSFRKLAEIGYHMD
jgi:hypothetical protein